MGQRNYTAISIDRATAQQAGIIHKLAERIWPDTYNRILPAEQIRLMMKNSYSIEGIRQHMAQGEVFYLLGLNEETRGFVALKEGSNGVMRVEKLYISREIQGLGLGKKLIDFACQRAIDSGLTVLELNVNRRNPAFHFYIKQGFVVIKETDIPYLNYILDDYVMQKKVKVGNQQ